MDLLKVFLISAVPLIEQRGAIPVGILTYGVHPLLVFVISYLGSLFPSPFILLLFNTIFKWMKRFRFFKIINNYIEKKLDRGSKKIEKYKEIGLIILVAIPLPTTGIWTGSAVASFLKMDFRKSILYIAVGGLISAIIITVVSYYSPEVLGTILGLH